MMPAAGGTASALHAAALRRTRRRLAEAWRQGAHPPIWLLNALCAHADARVRAVLRAAPLPEQAALVALGGYGRGTLYPGSDTDLLVLLAHPAEDEASARIATLVAALWDAGLEPSLRVFTLPECRTVARTDPVAQTALLEARWLAGAQDLVQDLRSVMHAGWRPAQFAQAKWAEVHARASGRAGPPNCKLAPGGLRDLHALFWRARCAPERAAALGPRAWQQLARAQAQLQRLRLELHLLTGRRDDCLRPDYCVPLARRLRLSGRGGTGAVARLLRAHQWATGCVQALNQRLPHADAANPSRQGLIP